MGPPQALDLIQLQEGFQSLISQAQPDHIPAFFYWLDLRVAQFKVFGSNLSQDNDCSPVRNSHFTNQLQNGHCSPDHHFTGDPVPPQERNGICNGANHRDQNYTLPSNINADEPVLQTRSLQDFCETPEGLQENRMVKSLLRAMLAKPKVTESLIKQEQDSASDDMPETATPLDIKDDDSQSANDSFNKDDPMSVESENESSAILGISTHSDNASTPASNEKASRCPYCLKVFRYRSSYRRHVKIHEGIFSHECTICLRKFTRKEHFVRHKCDRRPNKPYHITHEVFRRLSASQKAALRQASELYNMPLSSVNNTAQSKVDISAHPCDAGASDVPLELTSHASVKPEISESGLLAAGALGVLYSLPASVPLDSAAVLSSLVNSRSVRFAEEQLNEGNSQHHSESRRKSSTPRKITALNSDISIDVECSPGFPRERTGHLPLPLSVAE